MQNYKVARVFAH